MGQCVDDDTRQSSSLPSVVISFYRYVWLGDKSKAALAAEEQRRLGDELQLHGRVLVSVEGINGTVQGSEASVKAYELATARTFGVDNWKRSSVAADGALFPDFSVKEVPEIVSFGLKPWAPPDALASSTDAGSCASGLGSGGRHVPADEWDRLITQTPSDQLRIIDVRNTFEYEVGHFGGAIDTGMSQTAQWQKFVKNNLEDLQGKQVMLYCTGGIRCEKASAYLCQQLREVECSGDAGLPRTTATGSGDEECRPEEVGTAAVASTSRSSPHVNADAKLSGPNVVQLDGGIVKYLEARPDGGCFQGVNFVFDKRVDQKPSDSSTTVVGRCSECAKPWGKHHGGRVCCVCRALVLVCDDCDASSRHGEYYCSDHTELRGVYYYFVDAFGVEDLERQAEALRARLALEVGPKRKKKRDTLRKKLEQVTARLEVLREAPEAGYPTPPRRCRACTSPYDECPGACWGFWREVGKPAVLDKTHSAIKA
eukprot:TRINITY_DN56793_c0_g1_i1.p1 TRINITY_DN56793_c0_g1~~TRINITY_DN56793_c0_g1_i1.p1  ORF type:complete len:484 (+),score=77.92 TRINITY_DN56793_c0_g1_i1:75-1526(+)